VLLNTGVAFVIMTRTCHQVCHHAFLLPTCCPSAAQYLLFKFRLLLLFSSTAHDQLERPEAGQEGNDDS
jgi:hypothetical protein